MGENSATATKESKEKMGERGLPDYNQEELSEETQAALILLSMPHDKRWRKGLMVQKDEFPIKPKANPFKRSKPKSLKIQGSVNLAGIGHHPPNIPPVPSLRSLVGECSKPFGKWLTQSDMKDRLCRLSFKTHHVKTHLKNFVEGENLVVGIQVSTYDMKGNEYPMVFKLWSEKNYVLTGGWTKFRQDHGFLEEQDHFLTIWGFRHLQSEKLCFVIASTWTGSRVP